MGQEDGKNPVKVLVMGTKSQQVYKETGKRHINQQVTQQLHIVTGAEGLGQ